MTSRPKLLDLYSGAGGCAVGYHRAGFDVTGVDINPQPRYPFAFVQGDALEYVAAHGHEYDAIHASPPCQAYSEATPLRFRAQSPDLIAATRDALVTVGVPFAIENVENARAHMRNTVMLCGSMFGIGVRRHRYFETSPFWCMAPATCLHRGRPVVLSPGSNARKGRGPSDIAEQREAMGIDWMTGKELNQAIPPAYTEFVGTQIRKFLV
ncbi:MAG: DNA cytosine methyltransferase [Thermomicrobiales bacterium]